MVSSHFAGSVSDQNIVEHRGWVNIFKPGDFILADKNLAGQGKCIPLGHMMPIPLSLWWQSYIKWKIPLNVAEIIFKKSFPGPRNMFQRWLKSSKCTKTNLCKYSKIRTHRKTDLTSNTRSGKRLMSNSRNSSKPPRILLLTKVRIKLLETFNTFKFFIDKMAMGIEVKLLRLRSRTRTEVRLATASGNIVVRLLSDSSRIVNLGKGKGGTWGDKFYLVIQLYTLTSTRKWSMTASGWTKKMKL